MYVNVKRHKIFRQISKVYWTELKCCKKKCKYNFYAWMGWNSIWRLILFCKFSFFKCEIFIAPVCLDRKCDSIYQRLRWHHLTKRPKLVLLRLTPIYTRLIINSVSDMVNGIDYMSSLYKEWMNEWMNCIQSTDYTSLF